MDTSRESVLIIGSDSMIGRALIRDLMENGQHVIGTTRRRKRVNDHNLFLDLSMEPGRWTVPESARAAIVLAGVTKIMECKENPIPTRMVNVQGVVDLVQNLVAKNIFVIYLSTNQVFDGSKPYRRANEPLTPITEYGRQRADVETKIRHWTTSAAILRATKIFDSDVPLFRTWVKNMSADKVIHPFSDMVVSPIPLGCVISVLRIMISKKMPGVFQVSGNKDISYSDVAYLGADVLNLDPGLIQPISARRSTDFTEEIMKHTTLDMSQLREKIGVEPPDSEDVIKNIFIHMKNRGSGKALSVVD